MDKKKLEDLAIQQTSVDAISSKLAINKMHYTDDSYITIFLKKDPPFFNPILNRGSWARTYAIRKLLDNFISASQPSQVVSFGAGFDTNYFLIKSKYPTHSFKYVEIDFKEIADKKTYFISKNPILSNLTVNSEKEKQYHLLSGDIRDIECLGNIYKEAKLSFEVPTLFIAECVFVYLSSEAVDKMMKWNFSVFKNSSVIIYEMTNPKDPFGEIMVTNIESRGCNLHGLKAYVSLEDQKKRLVNFGCTKASALTMLDIYKILDPKERARIEKLQLFDEFEEWTILMQHYFISLGNKWEKPCPLELKLPL